MHRRRATLALFLLAVVALLATTALGPDSARAHPQETRSLMEAIEEWKYPDSTMQGASGSDGGNPRITSVKLQTVLTTPAPFDDVVKFYAAKAGVDPDSPRGEKRSQAGKGEAKSVAVQDDSKGRPVRVRVLAVHADAASTVVVITRAEGEKVTHIAWSQYRRTGQ